MYLKKKWKKFGSGVIAAILVGVAVLVPIQVLAASEAPPTVNESSANAGIMPISETLPSPAQADLPTDSISVSESAVTVEGETSTVITETTNSLTETTLADSSAAPAQGVTDASVLGETAATQILENASADSQQANTQQETNLFPLLIVLIGLVIVVAVIVAIVSAVSSVAVAVDDEEE